MKKENKVIVDNVIEKCEKYLKLDNKVSQCKKGKEGEELLMEYAQKSKGINKEHQFLINKERVEDPTGDEMMLIKPVKYQCENKKDLLEKSVLCQNWYEKHKVLKSAGLDDTKKSEQNKKQVKLEKKEMNKQKRKGNRIRRRQQKKKKKDKIKKDRIRKKNQKKKIENDMREKMEKETAVREKEIKEKMEKEIRGKLEKENIVREKEIKEKIEKEIRGKLEKERLEKERQENEKKDDEKEEKKDNEKSEIKGETIVEESEEKEPVVKTEKIIIKPEPVSIEDKHKDKPEKDEEDQGESPVLKDKPEQEIDQKTKINGVTEKHEKDQKTKINEVTEMHKKEKKIEHEKLVKLRQELKESQQRLDDLAGKKNKILEEKKKLNIPPENIGKQIEKEILKKDQELTKKRDKIFNKLEQEVKKKKEAIISSEIEIDDDEDDEDNNYENDSNQKPEPKIPKEALKKPKSEKETKLTEKQQTIVPEKIQDTSNPKEDYQVIKNFANKNRQMIYKRKPMELVNMVEAANVQMEINTTQAIMTTNASPLHVIKEFLVNVFQNPTKNGPTEKSYVAKKRSQNPNKLCPLNGKNNKKKFLLNHRKLMYLLTSKCRLEQKGIISKILDIKF